MFVSVVSFLRVCMLCVYHVCVRQPNDGLAAAGADECNVRVRADGSDNINPARLRGQGCHLRPVLDGLLPVLILVIIRVFLVLADVPVHVIFHVLLLILLLILLVLLILLLLLLLLLLRP